MITPEINGACSAYPNQEQGMNRGMTKREDIAKDLMAALLELQAQKDLLVVENKALQQEVDELKGYLVEAIDEVCAEYWDEDLPEKVAKWKEAAQEKGNDV
jgi:hypothetical protein